jgi:hypothetical protein|tara:strand:+ start:692 stop:1132 length:441 start_codon:yes stop_codon:yes gene_type:complete
MENRVLKSEFPEEWNGYDVIELGVNDIWASVPIAKEICGKPFYDKVKADIVRDGMRFPIMVVQTTYNKLEAAKEKWAKRINDLPFWHNELGKNKKLIWSVWGGSNRLVIARDLGYTHIHCAVLPTIGKAISLQKHMRKPFDDQYYK